MGKSALLLVAAFSVAGATLLYTGQETEVKASQQQSEYDADLIAREIARSAYNAAVSNANLQGSNIPAALAAVGTLTTVGCANNVAVCYRRDGVMQGGTFRVEASVNGGNSIDIYARGTYEYTGVQSNPDLANAGRRQRLVKTHEINETRSVGVLQVARSGKLSIQFIDSQAGYCSAIFLQRTPPGGTPGALEMVYIPGHNRNGDRNIDIERTLEPGVQMNFAIGVETNCAMQQRYFEPANAVWNAAKGYYVHKSDASVKMMLKKDPATGQPVIDQDAVKTFMANYVYRASDWNWTHWALDGGSLQNGDPIEAPWGMVETDPANTQRWRIAFEDIHDWNLPESDPNYENPNRSLWGLKKFGYDLNNDNRGDGWVDQQRTVLTPIAGRAGQFTVSYVAGQDGFHDLRDGNLDLSDQVIIVSVVPLDS